MLTDWYEAANKIHLDLYIFWGKQLTTFPSIWKSKGFHTFFYAMDSYKMMIHFQRNQFLKYDPVYSMKNKNKINVYAQYM